MACRRVTDSRVANIWEDRLADVWVCQMEKYRDYDKFKKCSKCELKAWVQGMSRRGKRYHRRLLRCRSPVLEDRETRSRERSCKMDLATCMKKMELVGVLAFATVDSNGAPQIRNISAIHYEAGLPFIFSRQGARTFVRTD